MNLQKKKQLAIKTLKAGKERIVFLESRRDEIKEAITKQDIRDLVSDGAIIIRKLRNYAKEIGNRGRISKENLKEIRKKIRNKAFKSKAHLKSYIKELGK